MMTVILPGYLLQTFIGQVKSTILFNIGAFLSGIFLLVAVTNTVSSFQIMRGQSGSEYSWVMWVMLLLLTGLIALAFWLKSMGKMLVANILIWLPAVPLLIVAGLALLFILHDIFYK